MSEKLQFLLGESVTEAGIQVVEVTRRKSFSRWATCRTATDKVNVEVPAPSNGILGNIAVKKVKQLM